MPCCDTSSIAWVRFNCRKKKNQLSKTTPVNVRFLFQPLIIKEQGLARAYWSCHFTSVLSSHTGRNSLCCRRERNTPLTAALIDQNARQPQDMFCLDGVVQRSLFLRWMELNMAPLVASTYTYNLQPCLGLVKGHSGICRKPLTNVDLQHTRQLCYTETFHHKMWPGVLQT